MLASIKWLNDLIHSGGLLTTSVMMTFTSVPSSDFFWELTTCVSLSRLSTLVVQWHFIYKQRSLLCQSYHLYCLSPLSDKVKIFMEFMSNVYPIPRTLQRFILYHEARVFHLKRNLTFQSTVCVCSVTAHNSHRGKSGLPCLATIILVWVSGLPTLCSCNS